VASAAIIPDLSLGRVVDDMLAYVNSIGEPTGLVGWSGGAMWALAMAAQSDAVRGIGGPTLYARLVAA